MIKYVEKYDCYIDDDYKETKQQYNREYYLKRKEAA